MIQRCFMLTLLVLLLSVCVPTNTGTVDVIPSQIEAVDPSPQAISSPTNTEQTASRVVEVPQGGAPTVDGTLSEGEWSGAYVESMRGGGELYFLHDKGYLYIGIDAGARGLGSLCANWEDQVEVLHSSAALGGRYYQLAAEDWQLSEETDWCCRAGREGDMAESEWQGQLGSYGWAASLANSGNRTQMEYQIALRDEPFQLAVVYMSMSGSLHVWPVDLTDDCLDRDLISEETPERLLFKPETWPLFLMK